MTDITRATVLAPGQLRHLLRVTEATSRHPARDAAILLLGLCCGMRCTETAQITVADLLFPSGKLRTEVSLRAVITTGCKQRCVYVSSPKLIAALERYLTFRVESRIGTYPDPEKLAYRGLRADLPLFITRKGTKFELNTKRRTLETGERREYLAADSLQSYITRLYAKAGIKGGSSHSGRRTFATRLYAQTHDMDVVQQLLGHDSRIARCATSSAIRAFFGKHSPMRYSVNVATMFIQNA